MCVCVCVCVCIRGVSISFQTFFVQAFKITRHLKIQYVIAIHCMR